MTHDEFCAQAEEGEYRTVRWEYGSTGTERFMQIDSGIVRSIGPSSFILFSLQTYQSHVINYLEIDKMV